MIISGDTSLDNEDLYLILKEQFDLEILLKLREICVLENEEIKLKSISEIISTITIYLSKVKNSLQSNSVFTKSNNIFQTNSQNKVFNKVCKKCRYKNELNSLFLFRNISIKKQNNYDISHFNCFENHTGNGFPRYLRSISKEVYFNGDDSDEIIESDLVL